MKKAPKRKESTEEVGNRIGKVMKSFTSHQSPK
jgi:hypothetical protein